MDWEPLRDRFCKGVGVAFCPDHGKGLSRERVHGHGHGRGRGAQVVIPDRGTGRERATPNGG